MAENRRIERLYKQIKADRHKEYLTLCNVHSVLFRRLCNGEEWLKEIVERLDDLLDDFSGEEARLWETAMK